MVAKNKPPAWIKNSMSRLKRELVGKYGAGIRNRLECGLKQVKEFWRSEDGDSRVFEDFVRMNFAKDRSELDTMFGRFESLFEKLFGHMVEISISFQRQIHLDLGPVMPYDELFAGYDVSAHLSDDLFSNKLAFVVLLNFPMTTLNERIEKGKDWDRRQWAEVRLGQFFSKRVPAKVKMGIAKASAESDKYISGYNIWMHHLLDAEGARMFPAGLKLLSHWGLRDELKANYADSKAGFARQKMIQKVMERIITQTIPGMVIDNPGVDWNPYTNEVKISGEKDSNIPIKENLRVTDAPEPDVRYSAMLKNFRMHKEVDPYSPTAPTYIARKFEEDREIPETKVRMMLEKIVSSPNALQIGKLIEKRLGRKLEPFDIWYDGFKERGKYSEEKLDRIVSEKYPSLAEYQKGIPELLVKLGFPKERAEYLAVNMVAEPARGSGQAIGAAMRGGMAHLQTRLGNRGMNYKSLNVAMHEMGHTVEQTLSLNGVDYWFLSGVPNTAFTEAFAFVFQGRDMQILELESKNARSDAMKTLDNFWNIYEIAGVSLVDMAVWNWLYGHEKAKPADLKGAVIDIAKRIWNKYYFPVFGCRDQILLGIYSHMISYPLYLADYTLGYMIKFQIEEQMKKAGSVGKEFERMATYGRVAPDIWMKNATGSEVGPWALLTATEKALAEVIA